MKVSRPEYDILYLFMAIETVENIIMDTKQNDEREREKGDAGRRTKQSRKRTYAKKRRYHGSNGAT